MTLATGPDRSAMRVRHRVRVLDLLAESVAGVAQRPLRSVLTGLGATIGVCAVVTVLGLTATASASVNARFDALRATEISVTAASSSDTAAPGSPGSPGTSVVLPRDAAARIAALPGVVGAGAIGTVDLGSPLTVASLPVATSTSGGGGTDVLTVTATAWAVLHPHVVEGRLYDAGHERRADRVAVLGIGAARQLGITRLDAAPAVFVDGVAMTVVGIVDEVRRRPDVLDAVMIPPSTAHTVWHADALGDATTTVLVETALGAATTIAARIPLAVDPAHPERTAVEAPPDPRVLGDSVGHDLDVLSLALTAVSVVLAALGISNTMLVTVMERVHEIGLRRALGAGGGQIAVQFLGEAAALGGLGGLAGCAVGVFAVIGVAVLRSWTPVLAPWVIATAPLLGLVAGLVAGVFPALRAARIQPADALRR